jgi:hypothetical protein
MRNLYLQARYWTYSMMYGQGHLMPPFTLNHTNGSGFVERFWEPLSIWLKRTIDLSLRWSLTKVRRVSGVTIPLWRIVEVMTRSYEKVIRRYQYIGRHRGLGRNTRTGIRRMREQRYDSLENRRVYQELMADPSTQTEPIVHVPGSRAYRKLAWSRLSHEAAKVRSRYYPGDST